MAGALVLGANPARAADPTERGPLNVERDVYDFGDTALLFEGIGPVELAGSVHYPVDLSGGPYPLITVMHGRHVTCYHEGGSNQVSGEWPCGPGRAPILSYEGYDYFSEILASYGYIVVSISANGINAGDNAVEDSGAMARAQLFDEHLDLWAGFNTTADPPFNGLFNGAIDLERIGTVGHSRGGEGGAAHLLADAEGRQRVDAVLLLAPTNFSRPVLGSTPMAVIVPYCDGDIFDLRGVRYFDDAAAAEALDVHDRYIFELAGSNHNFFNTTWSPDSGVPGGSDDFVFVEDAFDTTDAECSPSVPGNGRLSEDQQRVSFVAYAAAFLRTHVGGEEGFEELLRGDAEPIPATAPARPRVTYLGPGEPTLRLDINRTRGPEALALNDTGGEVVAEGLRTYEICGFVEDDGFVVHCVDDPFIDGDGVVADGQQPHVPGQGHVRLGYEAGASWTNRVPAGTDVSGYTMIQFRAVADVFNLAADQSAVDFSVVLTDGAGRRAEVAAGDFSNALARPLGDIFAMLPRLSLGGVRIPLEAFGDAVDLTDLASVGLEFSGREGSVLISDLLFSDETMPESGGETGETGEDPGPGDDTGLPGGTAGPQPGDGGSSSGGGGVDDGVDDDRGDSTSGGPTESGPTESGPSVPDADGGAPDGCACRAGPGASGWTGLWALAVLGVARPRARKIRPSSG